MILLLALLASLLLQATSVSQQIRITVDNLTVNRASISSLSGEKISFIDSIPSQGNGSFSFTLNERNNHSGLYRISFDKNHWIDFVNDGEDVTLQTDANAITDSIKVLRSESNQRYYAFLKLSKLYKTKSELLQLVLARYPKGDPYYRTTQTTVSQLEQMYADFVTTASAAKPTSFIARYIRSARLPVVDFNQPPDKQLAYLKAHALDNVDFNADGLIYSDVFTNKSIEYLTYYRNPQLPRELLEKEFRVAIDTLLGKAKVNTLVYQHITEYLIDGFKKFGFEKCIDYILENYVIKDDLCLNESTESTVQKMIDQKKKLPVGAIAPEVVLPDSNGKFVSLADIKAEKTLIVFYSTRCPHCQAILPQIHELYMHQEVKNLEVLAIALDTDKSEWLKFIRAKGLGWINVSDLAGWNSLAVREYYVYATPTMFIVGKDLKIVGVPRTIEEVKKYFE